MSVQQGIPGLFEQRVDMGIGPTGEPRTPLVWKRAADTSKAQITKLRHDGTLPDREQAILDGIAAYWNRHNVWPTAPELARWMFKHGAIPREDFNLVRPRLTELCIGWREFKDETRTAWRFVGGGRVVTQARRRCTVTGRPAHPYKLPQVGE